MNTFRFKLIEKEEVGSTNDELRKLDFDQLPTGYCILAHFQTQGKGQRGKQWMSNYGLNLMFSFLLKDTEIPPSHQFKLLQCVSVSVLRTIEKLTGKEAKVKWPNDIMVDGKKVCGILIENFIQAGKLNSIVGIGINVNQIQFPDYRPQPTSLSLLTRETFDIKLVLSLFEHEIRKSLELLSPRESALESNYRKCLYALGEMHDFETSEGEYMVAEVIGVDHFGRLVLNSNGVLRAFLNGDIRWLF